MSVGQFALQQSFFTALNVSAITDTLNCGVFDDVPQNATYPYIAIGEEHTDHYLICHSLLLNSHMI